jgi:ribosome-binding factor A
VRAKAVAHTFDRRIRVSDLIKHKLANLLLNSKDPRFTFVTISGVEVAKDYSTAKVFVTILNDDQINEIMAALNKAAGFFRSELAHSLNMRSTPKLHFYFDDTLRQGQRIDELLKKKKPDSTKE